MSVHSMSSRRGSIASIKDNDFESLSISSLSTMNTREAALAERLTELCNELGAPRGFLQIVGFHLLGHAKSNIVSSSNDKSPILEEIVYFMAKLFVHCSHAADLTVIVLDDTHHIDNLSWKVIQKIYETGNNILFLCGSRPLRPTSFLNQDDFWKSFISNECNDGRFHQFDIGPLDCIDIAKMASIVFSCEVKDIDNKFVNDIFDYTRGMAHFASQALETCKRKGLYKRLDNNKIGWRKDTSEVCIIFGLQKYCWTYVNLIFFDSL